MAFPGDYTKYQEVTIDHTKVGATLSNFPLLIDLSDMDKTTDIFDSCRSDGGDIRVTLSDGTTQLAREIVSIDTTGKTGEMWVKIPSLSSSADTTIRIWYNGSDTEPAEDATYGKENTWNSNYEVVQHLNQDPSDTAPQAIDSTSNDNDGTSAGTMTSGDLVGVKIGNGLEFDGYDDEINCGDTGVDLSTTNFTISCWLSANSVPASNGAWDHALTITNSAQSECISIGTVNTSGTAYAKILSVGETPGNGSALTLSTLYLAHLVWDGADLTLYIDGIYDYDVTPTGTDWQTASNFSIAAEGSLSINHYNFEGKIDEARFVKTNLSADWIATEYANQNSPSTFYSVSAEVSLSVATPVISPTSGEYAAGTTVTISCSTSGSTIYYTTDGSTPDSGDSVYSAPIEISDGMTIKAMATATGYADSDVASETYTISSYVAQPIVFIVT